MTQQLPTDERHLYSESYLHDSLAVRMGGRAAELLVLGEASTGAANDLAGATELATRMVRDWGFSTRLGPVGFGSGRTGLLWATSQVRVGLMPKGHRCSLTRKSAASSPKPGREPTRSSLNDRGALDAVIELLLEKETISGVELMDAVRRSVDSVESASGSR